MKGLVDWRGDYVFVVFSPLATKTYNNEALATKAGFMIMKSLTEYNKKFKEKYNSKNVTYIPFFSNIISREELLKKFYSNANIFLYPTLCDSFGYSFIDAMVAKLPIITTNLFASPEIVEDKKNGFVIIVASLLTALKG